MSWYWQALCVATALACGLLIGIERGFDLRELKPGTRVAGVRTFAMTGLVAGVAGLVGRFGQSFAAGALIAGCVAILTIGYANRPGIKRTPDATTPMAALSTVGLGFLSGFGEPGFGIAGAAVVTLLLALKAELHGFVDKLDQDDVKALARYAVIAGVWSCGSCLMARLGRWAPGTRRSCGWWSCWSPVSRSSAMSPTAFSASGTGPSPPR